MSQTKRNSSIAKAIQFATLKHTHTVSKYKLDGATIIFDVRIVNK